GQARGRGAVVAVVALVVQLVHREGENVGRPRLVHEVLVQGGHRVDVDEPDRQLDKRMDPHPVENMTCEPLEAAEVDVVPGRLVLDVDAQRGVRLWSGWAVGLSGRRGGPGGWPAAVPRR